MNSFNLHSNKLLPGIGRYADERFEGVLQVDLYKRKTDQSQDHTSEYKPHQYTSNHSHLAMFLFCALLIHISGPKTDKENACLNVPQRDWRNNINGRITLPEETCNSDEVY